MLVNKIFTYNENLEDQKRILDEGFVAWMDNDLRKWIDQHPEYSSKYIIKHFHIKSVNALRLLLNKIDEFPLRTHLCILDDIKNQKIYSNFLNKKGIRAIGFNRDSFDNFHETPVLLLQESLKRYNVVFVTKELFTYFSSCNLSRDVVVHSMTHLDPKYLSETLYENNRYFRCILITYGIRKIAEKNLILIDNLVRLGLEEAEKYASMRNVGNMNNNSEIKTIQDDITNEIIQYSFQHIPLIKDKKINEWKSEIEKSIRTQYYYKRAYHNLKPLYKEYDKWNLPVITDEYELHSQNLIKEDVLLKSECTKEYKDVLNATIEYTLKGDKLHIKGYKDIERRCNRILSYIKDKVSKLVSKYPELNEKEITEALLRNCKLSFTQVNKYLKHLYLSVKAKHNELPPYIAAIREAIKNCNGKTAVELVKIAKNAMKDLTGFNTLYMHFYRILDLIQSFFTFKVGKNDGELYNRYYFSNTDPLENIGITI